MSKIIDQLGALAVVIVFAVLFLGLWRLLHNPAVAGLLAAVGTYGFDGIGPATFIKFLRSEKRNRELRFGAEESIWPEIQAMLGNHELIAFVAAIQTDENPFRGSYDVIHFHGGYQMKYFVCTNLRLIWIGTNMNRELTLHQTVKHSSIREYYVSILKHGSMELRGLGENELVVRLRIPAYGRSGELTDQEFMDCVRSLVGEVSHAAKE